MLSFPSLVSVSENSSIEDYKQVVYDYLCPTGGGRDGYFECISGIENALKTNVWANNPDVKINMISYLGYPIRYPNGDFFGTICVLHDEPLKLKDKHKSFLATLRDSIEKDLLLEGLFFC